MYQDPKRIRKHRVSINLDDYEVALIQALVDYTGCDRSSLLRQMAIGQAETALIPTPPTVPANGGSNEALISSF